MTHSTRKFITSLAVVMLSSSPLLASAAGAGYKMAVIEDAPGAEYIKAGQFADAIALVQAAKTTNTEPFYRQVSLCVSYSSTAQFDLAETACNDAVQLAATLQAIPRSAKREMRALALNNRGVMNLMAGDKVAALHDFMQAVRLDSSEITLANLERLTVSINGNPVQEVALQAAE